MRYSQNGFTRRYDSPVLNPSFHVYVLRRFTSGYYRLTSGYYRFTPGYTVPYV